MVLPLGRWSCTPNKPRGTRQYAGVFFDLCFSYCLQGPDEFFPFTLFDSSPWWEKIRWSKPFPPQIAFGCAGFLRQGLSLSWINSSGQSMSHWSSCLYLSNTEFVRVRWSDFRRLDSCPLAWAENIFLTEPSSPLLDFLLFFLLGKSGLAYSLFHTLNIGNWCDSKKQVLPCLECPWHEASAAAFSSFKSQLVCRLSPPPSATVSSLKEQQHSHLFHSRGTHHEDLA